MAELLYSLRQAIRQMRFTRTYSRAGCGPSPTMTTTARERLQDRRPDRSLCSQAIAIVDDRRIRDGMRRNPQFTIANTAAIPTRRTATTGATPPKRAARPGEVALALGGTRSHRVIGRCTSRERRLRTDERSASAHNLGQPRFGEDRQRSPEAKLLMRLNQTTARSA